MKPVEGDLDPVMIARVATRLQALSFLPPLAQRESIGGVYVVRHPVTLLFRGAGISGAWISTALAGPIAIDQIEGYVHSSIPVWGKGHRVELAIHSAVVAIDAELRQLLEVRPTEDKGKLAAAHEAIDRWLLAERPTDPPLDSFGEPPKGPREFHKNIPERPPATRRRMPGRIGG